MSKMSKGALSSPNTQEKLAQALNTNKSSINQNRYSPAKRSVIKPSATTSGSTGSAASVKGKGAASGTSSKGTLASGATAAVAVVAAGAAFGAKKSPQGTTKANLSTINAGANVSGVSQLTVLPQGAARRGANAAGTNASSAAAGAASASASGKGAGASIASSSSTSAGSGLSATSRKALSVVTTQLGAARQGTKAALESIEKKKSKDESALVGVETLTAVPVPAHAQDKAVAVAVTMDDVARGAAFGEATSAGTKAEGIGVGSLGALGSLWAYLAGLRQRWGAMLWNTLWLFFPIFIGQLAATSMGVVDTVMAGAAGTLELSGVAIGSSIFWPSELFVVGMTLAIHPVVSGLVGAGQKEKIPERIQVATIVCLCFAALVGLVMILIPFVYRLLPQVDPQMVSIGHGYLLAVGLAMPAYAMFNVLRTYWEGLGKTWPTLCFGCMALLLNIPLNYIFIFGHLGMPALGGVGCGVATALTMYLTVGCMLLFVQKHSLFAEVRLYRRFYKTKVSSYVAFAKYALPLGVAGMVETLCFSLVSLLLSPFGPVVVAAHTIAMNVSGLLVIVPLALSSVASIEVGEALGRKDWALMRKRAASAVFLALSFYVVALMTLIFGRELIAAWYSSDIEVLELAPVLMLYCAVFLLPDTLQLMASGILRGFKDTRTIFIITLVAYWLIGMPIGLGLGYGYLTDALYGAAGFWFGFICSLSCASILLLWRLRQLLKKQRTAQLPA